MTVRIDKKLLADVAPFNKMYAYIKCNMQEDEMRRRLILNIKIKTVEDGKKILKAYRKIKSRGK